MEVKGWTISFVTSTLEVKSWLIMVETRSNGLIPRPIGLETWSNDLITRPIGMDTWSFLQITRPIEKAAHPMWVRRLIIELMNNSWSIRGNSCQKKVTNIRVKVTRSSPPASCGRRSCSGAEPSSEPRRRVPRPRWDKPSWRRGNEPRQAGSRGSSPSWAP